MAQQTGQSLERIQADTERDNFMTAYEAQAYGLIDRVIEGKNKEGLGVKWTVMMAPRCAHFAGNPRSSKKTCCWPRRQHLWWMRHPLLEMIE